MIAPDRPSCAPGRAPGHGAGRDGERGAGAAIEGRVGARRGRWRPDRSPESTAVRRRSADGPGRRRTARPARASAGLRAPSPKPPEDKDEERFGTTSLEARSPRMSIVSISATDGPSPSSGLGGTPPEALAPSERTAPRSAGPATPALQRRRARRPEDVAPPDRMPRRSPRADDLWPDEPARADVDGSGLRSSGNRTRAQDRDVRISYLRSYHRRRTRRTFPRGGRLLPAPSNGAAIAGREWTPPIGRPQRPAGPRAS